MLWEQVCSTREKCGAQASSPGNLRSCSLCWLAPRMLSTMPPWVSMHPIPASPNPAFPQHPSHQSAHHSVLFLSTYLCVPLGLHLHEDSSLDDMRLHTCWVILSLGSAWHRATVQYIFSELINTWIKPGLGLLWSLRPHWALFSSKVTISRDNIYFLITPRIKLLFNSCMYMSIPSQNIFKYFLPQCHPLHTHRRWVNECLMNYNQVRNLRWMN